MGKIPDIKYTLNKETIDPKFASGYFGEQVEAKGKKIPLNNLLESLLGVSEITTPEQVDQLIAELDKLDGDLSINSEELKKLLK